MRAIFPKDICNLIYTTRATLRLRDMCEQYELCFEKFCKFLRNNNAVLAGSAAIACFDVDCVYNDLDIFIICTGKQCDFRRYYKEFLHVFTGCSSTEHINIDKTPLENSLSEETKEKSLPEYHYTFNYNGKKIDMSIAYQQALNVIDKYNFFNISKFKFDGNQWITCHYNIELFLTYKYAVLINPYNSYFDIIYDAFHHTTLDTAIECSKKFIFNGTNFNENKRMRHIYNIYSFYYTCDESNILSNMLMLYNDLEDTNVTADNLEDVESKFQTVSFEDGSELELEVFIPPNDEMKNLIGKIFRTYKGVYKTLQYIAKGYVMLNIDKYLKVENNKYH